MNRKQIENLYKINGLEDFRLHTLDDLLKVHGIEYTEITGYDTLDEINQKIFQNFIINFYNSWGLEARSMVIPDGIYYVEEIEYLAKDSSEDDIYITLGHFVYSINRKGKRKILYSEKNENRLEIAEKQCKQYLRFEYIYDGKKVWLHIIKNGKEWY
ncbi:MAG: hypothetical protein ACOCRK_09660 [bacterium]